MATWRPLAVLPNLELEDAIDIGPVAFAPQHDSRVQDTMDGNGLHRIFLSRFRDAFGEWKYPSVLVADDTAAGDYQTVEAMASIRDVLSAAVVPLARANAMLGNQVSLPLCFSRIFDFYPWRVADDNDGLVMINPSLKAIHDVDRFDGQVSPEIQTARLHHVQIDGPLFDSLVKVWSATYAAGADPNTGAAFVRSLNMMHHASQLPALQDTRGFDYGRLTALWVSSFEILAHPGPRESVKLHHVRTLITSADWSDEGYGQIAARVYRRLYEARNAFIHGGDIAERHFRIGPNDLPLHHFAAPIYRMALASHVGLKSTVSGIEHSDWHVVGKGMPDWIAYCERRDAIEKAISLADVRLTSPRRRSIRKNEASPKEATPE